MTWHWHDYLLRSIDQDPEVEPEKPFMQKFYWEVQKAILTFAAKRDFMILTECRKQVSQTFEDHTTACKVQFIMGSFEGERFWELATSMLD